MDYGTCSALSAAGGRKPCPEVRFWEAASPEFAVPDGICATRTKAIASRLDGTKPAAQTKTGRRELIDTGRSGHLDLASLSSQPRPRVCSPLERAHSTEALRFEE